MEERRPPQHRCANSTRRRGERSAGTARRATPAQQWRPPTSRDQLTLNSPAPAVDAIWVKHAAPRTPAADRGWFKNEALIRVIALLAVLWGGVYLGWRVTVTWEHTAPALFALLFACEVFGWLMLAGFCFLSWRIPKSARPPIEQSHSVDVVVCTYDEGVDVLEATLLGCARISHPHVTWVLDDGRRDTVRELAQRFGARYVTRPDNSHAKAGNINHALDVLEGELLLVLDADHVPQPDILDATVGYFDDPEVAVVQTPHDFSNQDSFQHFATGRHDQSMFFEVILPGKDRHNGVFWCGSAAVIRRVALVEVGGVATQTIAEDFHTTIKMHRRGWKTRYHGETLVQGLAPHDLSSFLLQRDRWARGNLAVFKTAENPLVARHLTLSQRVSYLSSLMAYFAPLQRLGLLAVLAVMLVSGQLPMHATLDGFLTFWLPWIALDMAGSALLCRGRASLWDGTYSMLLTMEIFTLAALSLIGKTSSTFKVTPKDGIDDGGWRALSQLRLVMGITVVLAAALVLRGLAAAGLVPLPTLGTAPLVIGMVLGLWELGLATAALAKVGERRQLRRHYRAPGRLAAVVDDRIVRVVDLTTGGVGLVSPMALARGTETELTLDLPLVDGRTRSTRLVLTVTECRADQAAADRWRIGGTVTPRTEDDRTALMEFCHLVATRARLLSSGRLQVDSAAAPTAPHAPIGPAAPVAPVAPAGPATAGLAPAQAVGGPPPAERSHRAPRRPRQGQPTSSDRK
jgi:cellulose synthase/poly-beta-1,6-N-acetylglucosamine synthase-like glycosyltransferase